MENDFTNLPDRMHDGSVKWDIMLAEPGAAASGAVPLSIADMELATPPAVVDALRELVEGHVLGYTEPTDEYYEAVLGWQRRRHAWSPKREWVALSPGVVPAFTVACQVVARPGEGIIIQPPVYYPFFRAVRAAGCEVVENRLIERDGLRYEMDFDDLERKAADPANVALLLCSPHNPVGRVWTAEELRRVVDICLAHDVFVISDEIHDDLIMPGCEHTTIMDIMGPEERERCLVCTAPSKTFNLAGLQCSNIFIPDKNVREAFVAAFEKVGIGQLLNAFAYAACRAAYMGCDEWLEGLISLVDGNRRLVGERLAQVAPKVGVAPLQGTYLQWLDMRAWGKDGKGLEAFLHDHGLYLDEGYVFGSGGSGFERMNLACPRSVVEQAVERLAECSREAMGR